MIEEQGLKRAACLIASQLPDNTADALKVLEYARGIVRHLDEAPGAGCAAVIQFAVPRISQGALPGDDPADRTGFRGRANPG